MAYASTAPTPRAFAFTALPAFTIDHLSFWRMLRDALVESRRVQAEREIERYLSMTGGKLTDESEREIERLCMGQSARW